MNTAADLLAELTELGIELVASGDRLRYRPRSAVTPDLVERLRIHKAELLAILGQSEGRDGATGGMGALRGEHTLSVDPGEFLPIWRQHYIEPPEPCPGCGGLLYWWNVWGDRRCMTCDPPVAAMRLLERAERIRRRRGIPSPIGAADMLADLKRLTDT